MQLKSDSAANSLSGFGGDERLREVLEVERWMFPGGIGGSDGVAGSVTRASTSDLARGFDYLIL